MRKVGVGILAIAFFLSLFYVFAVTPANSTPSSTPAAKSVNNTLDLLQNMSFSTKGGSFYYVTADRGDIDGDGQEEIVILHYDWIFALGFNAPTQQLYVKYTFNTTHSNRMHALKVKDINGDGKAEILVGNTANAVFIYEFNSTTNDLDEVASLSVPDDVYAVDAGDIDNDGNPDVVIGFDPASGVGVVVYENQSGTWVNVWNNTLTTVSYSAAPHGIYVTSASNDFDNDGMAEFLVVTGYQGSNKEIVLFEFSGTDNTYTPVYTYDESSCYAVEYGDFDNDGNNEFAVLHQIYHGSNPGLRILENDGTDNGVVNRDMNLPAPWSSYQDNPIYNDDSARLMDTGKDGFGRNVLFVGMKAAYGAMVMHNGTDNGLEVKGAVIMDGPAMNDSQQGRAAHLMLVNYDEMYGMDLIAVGMNVDRNKIMVQLYHTPVPEGKPSSRDDGVRMDHHEFIFADAANDERTDFANHAEGDIVEFRMVSNAPYIYFWVKMRDIIHISGDYSPIVFISIDLTRDGSGNTWLPMFSDTQVSSNASWEYCIATVFTRNYPRIYDLGWSDIANSSMSYQDIDPVSKSIFIRINATSLGIMANSIIRITVSSAFYNSTTDQTMDLNSVSDLVDVVSDNKDGYGTWAGEVYDGVIDFYMDFWFDPSFLLELADPIEVRDNPLEVYNGYYTFPFPDATVYIDFRLEVVNATAGNLFGNVSTVYFTNSDYVYIENGSFNNASMIFYNTSQVVLKGPILATNISVVNTTTGTFDLYSMAGLNFENVSVSVYLHDSMGIYEFLRADGTQVVVMPSNVSAPSIDIKESSNVSVISSTTDLIGVFLRNSSARFNVVQAGVQIIDNSTLYAENGFILAAGVNQTAFGGELYVNGLYATVVAFGNISKIVHTMGQLLVNGSGAAGYGLPTTTYVGLIETHAEAKVADCQVGVLEVYDVLRLYNVTYGVLVDHVAPVAQLNGATSVDYNGSVTVSWTVTENVYIDDVPQYTVKLKINGTEVAISPGASSYTIGNIIGDTQVELIVEDLSNNHAQKQLTIKAGAPPAPPAPSGGTPISTETILLIVGVVAVVAVAVVIVLLKRRAAGEVEA